MAEWIEQLERLTALHSSGALTDAEFAEQKTQLLAGAGQRQSAPVAPDTGYAGVEAVAPRAVPWLPIGIGAVLVLAIAGGVYFAGSSGSDAAASATVAANAEPTGPLKTFYAAAKANIRNQPSGQGTQVVGELSRGQSVTGREMIGSDGTSKWLKRDGVAEYVWMVNLVETQPPAIESVVGARKTSGSDITLYASPSTTSPARQVVKAGAELDVLSKLAGGWGEARLQGGAHGVGVDVGCSVHGCWSLAGVCGGRAVLAEAPSAASALSSLR